MHSTFVQAQHRGVFADNTKRATEIVAFIEARSAPSTRPLHALALFARRGEAEVADAPSRAQAKRVFDVAACALNTVAACAAAGGARALVEAALLRLPQLVEAPRTEEDGASPRADRQAATERPRAARADLVARHERAVAAAAG